MLIKYSKNFRNIETEGEFVNSFCKNVLSEKNNFDFNTINKIISNSTEIFSNFVIPSSCNKKNGLLIGKPQSGKTLNFISLIALSFDNGYNISVVLGGNKNVLLKQTTERIEAYFSDAKDQNKLVILNTHDDSSMINKDDVKSLLKQGKKIIFISLETSDQINLLASLFTDDFIKKETCLIIDDEGDQASLNTKKFSKKGPKQSSIYSSILSLKSSINTLTYVSVTATPQANILIETIDALSPDFGCLINPGDGYCGLNEFHSPENVDKKIICFQESDFDTNKNVFPTAYKKAIITFFAASAIRILRNDFGNNAALFHPSQKKLSHNHLYELIREYINKIKTICKNVNDVSFKTIENYICEAYEMYKNDGVLLPEFNLYIQEVVQQILDFSPNNIILYNGDSCNKLEHIHQIKKRLKEFKSVIFIGGNMVERGLTIDGLTISVIERRAKNISNMDTTEQRARWFGYRRKYLDLCKIFTTYEIKSDFNTIYKSEESLWDTINKNKNSGISFKNIDWEFIRDEKLFLTRRNVARTKDYNDDYAIISHFLQQDHIDDNQENNDKNFKLISSIISKNNLVSKKFGNESHDLIKNLPFDYVNKEILEKFIFPSAAEQFTNKIKCFVKNISSPKVEEEAKNVDIVFVRWNQEKGERDIDTNGKILTQIMTGYRASYPGDYKLPEEIDIDKIQIQFHKIRRKSSQSFSPCIVIYVPPCLLRKINSNNVRRTIRSRRVS